MARIGMIMLHDQAGYQVQMTGGWISHIRGVYIGVAGEVKVYRRGGQIVETVIFNTRGGYQTEMNGAMIRYRQEEERV